MADIFVSYASEDRPRVRNLVHVLEAQGWSVWWDRQIEVGSSFDKVIEAAIDEARCIIVIWSKASVQSDWVRAEAAEGLERSLLVPVLFEDLRPPLLFRQKQACRLIDWPDSETEDLEDLLNSVRSVLSTERNGLDGPSEAPSVAVLLADVRNETDSDIYSGSIDELLRLRLEEVPGVYVYPRDQAVLLLADDGPLDIDAATRVGAREGIDFVVGIAVRRVGANDGIDIEIRPIADLENVQRHSIRIDCSESVAQAGGELVEILERALLQRDTTLRFHSEEITAISLEALRAYNTAQRMASEERFEEAIQYYRDAVDHDTEMGRAHSGWAVAAYALGQVDVARDQWRLALKYLDQMTEPERLRTLGVYYALGSQNYEKASETFRQLLRRSPLDARALNNLAVVDFSLLNFRGAMESGRRAIEVFPDSVLYRSNYALYAMYASDFETARVEAETVLDANPRFVLAHVARAVTALVEGDRDRALTAYDQMEQLDTRAATLAKTAKADLAMASGEWERAEAILTDAIETDRRNANTRAEAAKLLMVAECRWAVGDEESTRDYLEAACALSLDEARLTTAGSLRAQIGDLHEAHAIAEDLSSRLGRPARAYGRVVDGYRLAAESKFGDAVDDIKVALEIADVWCAHVLLAEVMLRAGHPFEAMEELDTCLRRAGEASAMYLDDIPTFRFVEYARHLRDVATKSL